MADVQLPECKPWQGKAYRSIATCDPSQSLYDDLGDPDDCELLAEIELMTQGIDHDQPQGEQWLLYGDIERSTACLEAFFGWGRFGQGTYGVWYGALDEQTSIKESSAQRPELDAHDFANAHGPIIQCRRLFAADLDAMRASDLRQLKNRSPELISSDYSFCQQLGAMAVEQSIDMFLTPSARHEGGVCTPVFSKECITSEQAIRTYLVIYSGFGEPPRFATLSDDA